MSVKITYDVVGTESNLWEKCTITFIFAQNTYDNWSFAIVSKDINRYV